MSSIIEEKGIPGTVHLVDIEGTLNVEHEDGDDIVLIPQPTLNPDDPLRWSKRKKYAIAVLLLWTVFAFDILTLALSPVLLVIQEDTGIPLSVLNSGQGVLYLFFGYLNLVWQGLGLNYGRRPVLLICLLGCTLCSVWAGKAKSVGEWYANRIIIGCFFGPAETLIEVCMSDIFFAHERGSWISWYVYTLFTTPFLSGVATGFIADRYGWQWIQYIASIISGTIFVILFFFLEETFYYRDPQLELSKLDDVKSVKSLENDKKDKVDVNVENVDDSSETQQARKTYLQKLKFWGARDPRQKNTVLQSLWMPFYLLRFPSVFFGGLTAGNVVAWYTIVNSTMSSVLSAAPYNFSANMIGVFFLSPVVGITIGTLLAGSLGDKFAIYKARKGVGLREPESKLYFAVIPLLTHPFGCFLFGIGAGQGIHWIGLAFGMAMICSTFPIGSTIAINYIIDSYKEVSGDGLVTMIIIRNTIGFGFGYAVTPWLQNSGTQNLYVEIGCIGVALWATTFLMIIFGKKFRKDSSSTYWNLVEKYGFKTH